MKLSRYYLLSVATLTVFAMQPAWAEIAEDVTGTTDGKLSKLLSQELYCGTKSVLEGNVGLALGLLIMFGALWSLARGGKMMPAVTSLIFGAIITAIPSLLESGLSGLGNLMSETGMSKKETALNPPECNGDIEKQIDEQFKRAEENRKLGVCTGGYLDCS